MQKLLIFVLSISHQKKKKKKLDNCLTSQHEDSAHRQQNDAHQGDDTLEENFKLLSVEFAAQVVDERMDLAQAKHTKGCHVLGRLHWLRRENKYWSFICPSPSHSGHR